MDLYSSLASVSATSGTNAWTITGTISLDGVGPGDMIIVGSRTFWGSSQKGFRIATIDRVAKTFTTTDNADTTYSGAAFFIRYTGSGINFLPGMLQTVLNRLDAMFGIGSTIFAGGGTRFLLSRQSGASAIAELMFALRSGDTTTGAFFLRQRQVSGVEVLDFISTTDGTTEVVVFRITRAGVVSFPSSLSTVAFQAESLNTGPLGGLRNLLINGSMDIWQRGTSFSADGYTADRWRAFNITSVSRSTDVPDDRFTYSLEFANSAASFPYIEQRIEAANARHLVGKKARFSFWAKNVSGSSILYITARYATALNNFASQTEIISTTAASSPASSWQRYTIDLGTIPAGAVNGLAIAILRNNAPATTTRVTGLQLEIGDVATAHEFIGERGGIAAEIARCHRYFERIGNVVDTSFVLLTAFSPTVALGAIGFFEKRSSPSISFGADSTYRLVGNGAGYSISSPTASGVGTQRRYLQVASSGLTSGMSYLFQRAEGETAYIDVSSEL